MKNKFKIFTLVASLVLVAILTFTMTTTGAWFTDAKSGGSITITVGGDVAITVTPIANTTATAVLPGDTITLGSATIGSAVGNSACYLRAKLSVTGTGVDGVAKPTTVTGWIEDTTSGYWYYCSTSVSLTNMTLFGQSKDANNTEAVSATFALGNVTIATSATETTLIPANTATITLIVEAIQARNLTADMLTSTTAWASVA